LQLARDRRLGATGSTFRFAAGADQLAQAIGLALGERLRLPAAVLAVEHDEQEVRVTYTEGPSTRIVAADQVVFAVPPPALRDLPIQPPLSAAKQAALRGIPLGRAVRVLLQYRRRFWRDVGASGTLLTDLPVQQVVDATAGQPGERGILACTIGGAVAAQLAALPHDRRVATCAQAIETVYGGAGLLERAQSTVWEETSAPRGCVSYYPPGSMTVLGPVIGLPEGRLHFCGEHTDAWQGTLEGAVRSGERAAGEVLERRAGRPLSPWLLARRVQAHAGAPAGT
jgi:monoamine oxidase